jgi:hypothetical protein
MEMNKALKEALDIAIEQNKFIIELIEMLHPPPPPEIKILIDTKLKDIDKRLKSLLEECST